MYPDVTGRGVPCVVQPESVEALDEGGYLKANPDVARAGMTAQDHFLQYGRREGRLQRVNESLIKDLREEKLRRLKFRTALTQERMAGEAMNFLSSELIAEFGIPDTPPVSSHPYGAHLVQTIEESPTKLFLDVGAGLRKIYFHNVVNTEIYASPSTDVLCVGEDLPFSDEQFDYVFAIAVLEHTRRPWEVAREMVRVIKPGGTLIVDYPFLQAVHGYPHHYFNATAQGNRSLFEQDCDIVSLTVNLNQGPIHSLYWILANWRGNLPPADATLFEQVTVGDLLSRPPEQQLSEAYCRNLSSEAQMIIAAGTTLIAVKRARTSPMLPTPPLPSHTLLPREVALLQQENETLRRELQITRNSTSWRLLAPARALVDRVRRRRTGGV